MASDMAAQVQKTGVSIELIIFRDILNLKSLAFKSQQFMIYLIDQLSFTYHPTGTIYLSQLRDVTKALPGKLPVNIKFRLFPIDCDVRDVLF